MREYPKIQTIWKRDERGTIMRGDYSTPELEYLARCEWEFTEKIDGTNIRVHWDGERVTFGGRTDNAQLPNKLVANLQETFIGASAWETFSPDTTLFGEGYGAGIQKGGSNYRGDQGFILFDVLVGNWWLRRDTVAEVAAQFDIPVVPVLARGTLSDMALCVENGLHSRVAQVLGTEAEGIVARTPDGLLTRNGEPLLVKIKARDFR